MMSHQNKVAVVPLRCNITADVMFNYLHQITTKPRLKRYELNIYFPQLILPNKFMFIYQVKDVSGTNVLNQIYKYIVQLHNHRRKRGQDSIYDASHISINLELIRNYNQVLNPEPRCNFRTLAFFAILKDLTRPYIITLSCCSIHTKSRRKHM